MAAEQEGEDAARPPASGPGAKVLRPAAFQLTDEALVEGALAHDDGAKRQLFERHGRHVERVLMRLLGDASELGDALHDVFVQVFRDLEKLRDPSSFKAWTTQVAVYVARGRIRRRMRRRWLRFMAPGDVPTRTAAVAEAEVTEALRSVYVVMDGLPADERIAFALRIIEGMELKEVAEACDCSLATVKRRIKRAETAFVAAARDHESLRPWLIGGSRWTTD